jgi:hypothetical protein
MNLPPYGTKAELLARLNAHKVDQQRSKGQQGGAEPGEFSGDEGEVAFVKPSGRSVRPPIVARVEQLKVLQEVIAGIPDMTVSKGVYVCVCGGG